MGGRQSGFIKTMNSEGQITVERDQYSQGGNSGGESDESDKIDKDIGDTSQMIDNAMLGAVNLANRRKKEKFEQEIDLWEMPTVRVLYQCMERASHN